LREKKVDDRDSLSMNKNLLSKTSFFIGWRYWTSFDNGTCCGHWHWFTEPIVFVLLMIIWIYWCSIII